LDDEFTHVKSKKQNILIFSEFVAGSCWFALTEIRRIIIKNGFRNQEEVVTERWEQTKYCSFLFVKNDN